MFEISKQFRFDSAHTLERKIDVESSRRVHGHSYRAEVTVRGPASEPSGMVVDVAVLGRALAKLHDALDHRMLNEISGLEAPTMENLCRWIWQKLIEEFPNLSRVAVYRDSNDDSCAYYGP